MGANYTVVIDWHSNQHLPIEETEMFTVLSNTRNSNLYLISAVAIMIVVLLTLAVVPSIAVRGPAIIPVTGVQSSNLEFRRGEWTAGASAYQAYLDQRYGEQHQGHAINAQDAYLEFRRGEQSTGVNAAK